MIHKRRYFPLAAIFNRIKWRLTLTYTLVALAAVTMVAWWVFIAVTIYINQTTPEQSWAEVIQVEIIPALRFILPSAVLLILPAALLSAFFGFLSARWLESRLAELNKAITAWRQGNFSIRVQDQNRDEISFFGSDLNHMAEDLELLLLTRQELAAFKERSRLARDLHDSVKQQLTAAALQIGAARALAEKDPAASHLNLAQAEDQVHSAQKELSSIIFQLRPAALESQDLPAALRDYLDQWAKQNDIDARFEFQGMHKVTPLIEQTLFRFVQEALANIARHSHASLVEINLSLNKPQILLVIRDNGKGFDPEQVRKGGTGLRNLRERIELVGGNFLLETSPGRGVRLEARIEE